MVPWYLTEGADESDLERLETGCRSWLMMSNADRLGRVVREDERLGCWRSERRIGMRMVQ